MKKIRFIVLFVALSTALQGQINIENRTRFEAVQTIAEIIAYDIMEFDTLNLTLFLLPKGGEIEGAVNPNIQKDHTYTMVIDESISLKKLMVMMAHEFVHIHQYEFEGLEIFGDIWVWNPDNLKSKQGVTWGSMTYTPYRAREFEKDAYRRQHAVAREVSRTLKSRNLLAKYK